MTIVDQRVTSSAPARSPVELVLVEDFATLEPRKSEWNQLVQRAQTNTIFQTYECHASWWKVFGDEAKLLVLLAEADGMLVGIAPLMVSERRILQRTQRVVQFIGARIFDYCDFIIDRTRPDVLPLFLRKLEENGGLFDLLYLRDIPGTAAMLTELPAFFRVQGLPTDMRVLYEAPTRLFNDPVADRQLPNKKSLRRHQIYFQKSGHLEFKQCTDSDEAMGYLGIFFEQHIRRRASTDSPSLFIDERMQAFFRDLASTLAPKRWLLFSVLLFNQKPIAMHFGFEYGKRITWYKPAFDMEYAKHSPGEVLIKYLIEYALERKVDELDFTIGEEAFKYRFANQSRTNYAVRVYRRWAPYYINRLVLDARQFIEHIPPLNRIARRLLSRWRNQPRF